MLAKVYSAVISGIDAVLVEVQVAIENGLPGIFMVGLPDMVVKESRDRISTAIRYSGYRLPIRRIVVNLAPAQVRKGGSALDLAIAMGILISSEQIAPIEEPKNLFWGELGLDGRISPCAGALSVAIAALRSNHIENLFLPPDSAKEALAIKSLKVFSANALREIVEHINGDIILKRCELGKLEADQTDSVNDFSEVKGQLHAKRAVQIACAGLHNCLMIGPPGSGKTMLASRVPTILPKMSEEEQIEISRIHSVAASITANIGLLEQRPFRSPHHSASTAALVGGGSIPQPGEVSLAHFGVLFLDELTEFKSDSLQALRQPLEDRLVTISRANAVLTFPADFLLIAAMNPCPCGYYGHSSIPCRCTKEIVRKYLSKLSGPFVDRIDIQIEVPQVPSSELFDNPTAVDSNELRTGVEKAIGFREERLQRFEEYQNSSPLANGRMPIQKFMTTLNAEQKAMTLLRDAFERLSLSARSFNKTLRVARTIADLELSDIVEEGHVLEALQYRGLERLLNSLK